MISPCNEITRHITNNEVVPLTWPEQGSKTNYCQIKKQVSESCLHYHTMCENTRWPQLSCNMLSQSLVCVSAGVAPKEESGIRPGRQRGQRWFSSYDSIFSSRIYLCNFKIWQHCKSITFQLKNRLKKRKICKDLAQKS